MQMNNVSHPPIFDNSLYRRLIIRPIAKKMAPKLVKYGLTDNGVCWLKLAIGLLGAFSLISVYPLICLTGMLLLHLHFLLDAADGEVARLRNEASLLSGEYFDKLTDHLPKTAMYFCWGLGGCIVSDSLIPLFCGTFFAAWNIYPRFCMVETLLERLDKAPEVYDVGEFGEAVNASFITEKKRGKADFFLTVFFHPVMNVLTICYFIEAFIPVFQFSGNELSTRFVLISIIALAGLWNFVRKAMRYFEKLNFR